MPMFTLDQLNSPEFMLALLDGRTPPGVEPGSDQDTALRDMADQAAQVAADAGPMSPEQKVAAVGLLRRT